MILCFMIGFWSSAAGRAWSPPGRRGGRDQQVPGVQVEGQRGQGAFAGGGAEALGDVGVSPYEVLEDLPAGRAAPP